MIKAEAIRISDSPVIHKGAIDTLYWVDYYTVDSVETYTKIVTEFVQHDNALPDSLSIPPQDTVKVDSTKSDPAYAKMLAIDFPPTNIDSAGVYQYFSNTFVSHPEINKFIFENNSFTYVGNDTILYWLNLTVHNISPTYSINNMTFQIFLNDE